MSVASEEFALPFLDRTPEIGLVREVSAHSNDVPHCCVFRTLPASGFSSFLRHTERVLASDNCLTVYASSLEDGPDILFDRFFNALEKQMDQLFRKVRGPEKLKTIARDMAGNALNLLPGAIIARPLLDKAFEGIRTSYFASAQAERFALVVRKALADKTILFLIDNAQNLREDGLDVFRTTYAKTYENVRYVLGFVERPSARLAATDFAERIRSLGRSVVVEDFAPPDHLLVQDIFAEIGYPVSRSQAEAILAATDGNTHRIVAAAYQSIRRRDGRGEPDLSPLQEAMIRYLLVAGQPLPERDLYAVLDSDPEVLVAKPQDMRESMHRLKQLGLVVGVRLGSKSEALYLSADTHPTIIHEKENRIACRTSANRLYRYITPTRSENNVQAEMLTSLRYRLAKKVDPERAGTYARDMVWHAIRSGSLETPDRFLEALPPAGKAETYLDFFVPVAFLISVKRYREALERLLHTPKPEWENIRINRVLRAVALDRCRHQDSALKLTEILLEDSELPEEQALLGSVRISSLTHLDRAVEARAFFKAFYEVPKTATTYGYFLRNAAAAFPPNDAIPIVEAAIDWFETINDRFGASTCENNLGSYYCSLGNFEAASPLYQLAAGKLADFGTQNLEEVLCNLSYIDLRAYKFDRAIARLQELLAFAENNVPKLYAMHHMAIALFCQRRIDQAVALITEAQPLAESVGVPIARLRHQVNGLLLLQAAGVQGELEGQIRSGLPQTGEPFAALGREMVSQLRAVGSFRSLDSEAILQLYRPGYLEYWSQNPLEVLPKALLPFDAKGEYVGEH